MCSEKISNANLELNEEDEISYTEVLDRLRRLDVGEYYLEKLEWIFSRLTPMAWRVVVMRFGLDDGRCKTLDEVSEACGITIERIRCIEMKFFRMAWNCQKRKKIKNFLDM